jgi:hypothetical protein
MEKKEKRKSKPRKFRLASIYEVVDYFCEREKDFTVSFTGYSVKVEAGGEKYFFSNSKGTDLSLYFFSKMKKEIGELKKEASTRVDYYDFTGIFSAKEKEIEKCYCIDLNSAYLRVLLKEGLISEDTFSYIDQKSRVKASFKEARLKSVGMFAKSSTEIVYKDGLPQGEPTFKTSPTNWVYFFAAGETVKAMKEIKRLFPELFLCYWVDGVFIRGQPELIKKTLEELGFPCKIEEIANLQITEKALFYTKEGKEKILFLPKNNTIEAKEFRSLIKKSTRI